MGQIALQDAAVQALVTNLNGVLSNFQGSKDELIRQVNDVVGTTDFAGASADAIAEFSDDLNNAYLNINAEFEQMISQIQTAAATIIEADQAGAAAH